MNDDETKQRELPLAWGLDGDPIDVPVHAAGWRVRRMACGPKGGAPEVLYANGIPLMIPIDATAEGLGEAVDGVPGKYRLEPVDGTGRVLREAVIAYAVIDGAMPASVPTDPLARVLGTVERLAKANADAMERVSGHMATLVDASSRLVAAADSAGVTRREPPAPVQLVAPMPMELAPEEKPAWSAMLETVVPQVLGPLLIGVFEHFKTKFAAQPAAAGPVPGTPPPGRRPSRRRLPRRPDRKENPRDRHPHERRRVPRQADRGRRARHPAPRRAPARRGVPDHNRGGALDPHAAAAQRRRQRGRRSARRLRCQPARAHPGR